MFGDEWAAVRTFPNRIVRGGERVEIGDTVFAVTDLGPGESPHDSVWRPESDGAPQAFVGDLVYSHMHAFLADGFFDHWLANLARAKRELPADTTLFTGDGQRVAVKMCGDADWVRAQSGAQSGCRLESGARKC